jgi:hypothetical protein
VAGIPQRSPPLVTASSPRVVELFSVTSATPARVESSSAASSCSIAPKPLMTGRSGEVTWPPSSAAI